MGRHRLLGLRAAGCRAKRPSSKLDPLRRVNFHALLSNVDPPAVVCGGGGMSCGHYLTEGGLVNGAAESAPRSLLGPVILNVEAAATPWETIASPDGFHVACGVVAFQP